MSSIIDPPFLVVPPAQVAEIQEAMGASVDVLASKPLPQLLGPDGSPIQPKQEIPFIQWLPNGESTGRSVDRGSVVYDQAKPFIACGGRYAFVLRADDMAELVAGFPVKEGEKGEMVVIAEEVVPNGPEIGPAVDRLVIASIANMDKLPVTETVQ